MQKIIDKFKHLCFYKYKNMPFIALCRRIEPEEPLGGSGSILVNNALYDVIENDAVGCIILHIVREEDASAR